jgi:hypothetical protein
MGDARILGKTMMRSYKTMWAAAVVLALFSLGAMAEDAPKPDGPSKAEAAPGAEAPKADPAPAAGGTPADPNDPTVVSGDVPKYPLESKNYSIIIDDYEKIGDNFNRSTGEMELDFAPMDDVMTAIRGSSQEHLAKSIEPDVTFKMLMKEPEKYRGHVVKLVGLLAPVRKSGFAQFYKGQITNSNGQIVSFRSLEPLPQGMKEGQPVQLVGVFLQRYCYLNQEPGEKLTWTPLLFVRRVEPYNDMKNFNASQSPMSNAAAIIVFIFVSLGAAAYMYSRMKYKVAAANHFTRMKTEKEGPQNNIFPRRSATPRKPPEKKKPEPPKPSEGTASPGSPPAST